jgi:hypothetical protein
MAAALFASSRRRRHRYTGFDIHHFNVTADGARRCVRASVNDVSCRVCFKAAVRNNNSSASSSSLASMALPPMDFAISANDLWHQSTCQLLRGCRVLRCLANDGPVTINNGCSRTHLFDGGDERAHFTELSLSAVVGRPRKTATHAPVPWPPLAWTSVALHESKLLPNASSINLRAKHDNDTAAWRMRVVVDVDAPPAVEGVFLMMNDEEPLGCVQKLKS